MWWTYVIYSYSKSVASWNFHINIWRVVSCKKIDSKSDKTKKSWFKIWQDEEFFFKIMLFTRIFFQNHASYKKLLFKIVLFNFFFVKLMLSKTPQKTQKLRNFWGKLNENVIFCAQIFFKIVLLKKQFFLQNRAFWNLFFFKIILFKKYSDSKSDSL